MTSKEVKSDSKAGVGAKSDAPASDLDRLHEFCRRGIKESVAELISELLVLVPALFSSRCAFTEKTPKLVSEKGVSGNTALHWAAHCESSWLRGMFSSSCAFAGGQTEVCELLIASKADVNQPNEVKVLRARSIGPASAAIADHALACVRTLRCTSPRGKARPLLWSCCSRPRPTARSRTRTARRLPTCVLLIPLLSS